MMETLCGRANYVNKSEGHLQSLFQIHTVVRQKALSLLTTPNEHSSSFLLELMLIATPSVHEEAAEREIETEKDRQKALDEASKQIAEDPEWRYVSMNVFS